MLTLLLLVRATDIWVLTTERILYGLHCAFNTTPAMRMQHYHHKIRILCLSFVNTSTYFHSRLCHRLLMLLKQIQKLKKTHRGACLRLLRLAWFVGKLTLAMLQIHCYPLQPYRHLQLNRSIRILL